MCGSVAAAAAVVVPAVSLAAAVVVVLVLVRPRSNEKTREARRGPGCVRRRSCSHASQSASRSSSSPTVRWTGAGGDTTEKVNTELLLLLLPP